MRERMLRGATLVVVIAALVLFGAGPAFAAVHVTTETIGSFTMTATVASTGDAGFSHGNLNDHTSPIYPSVPSSATLMPPASFRWFNQPVAVTSFGLSDVIGGPRHPIQALSLAGLAYQLSTNGTTWGPPTPVTGPLSANGVYSLSAGVLDEGTLTHAPVSAVADNSVLVTGDITPAFGVDKVPPLVSANVHPFYSGIAATITITSTDTISGVEDLQYSLDNGPLNYSWDAVPGQPFAVPIGVGPGGHTLRWYAFDNAGNVTCGFATFAVRPLLTLVAKTHTGYREASHVVTYSGKVTPMPTDMTLTVTVQHKVHGSWKYLTTYAITVPALADTYSFVRTIPRDLDGSFRAIATEGVAVSDWSSYGVH